ncbi:MAG: HEAT repeat domain-containing protein [Simkaniaceae bacterium]|nr:HEAT repeat domain-containing protein [Simkaniaceae bacterium]
MTRYLYQIHVIEAMLVIEIILIIIAVAISILAQYFLQREEKRAKKITAELKNTLIDMINTEAPYDIHTFPKKNLHLPYVVKLVYELDTKIRGDYWDKLKYFILVVLVKDQVYYYLESKNWHKRGFALQALGLTQTISHEVRILKMLRDRAPVIRFNAAASGIRLKTRQSTDAIINAMNRETPFARYSYRDVLIRADDATYRLLHERLREEKGDDLRVCCLEILSQKMGYLTLQDIESDFTCGHLGRLWWATRALENIPCPESLQKLRELTSSEHWQIRALAARNMGVLVCRDCKEELTRLVEDGHWYVRLSAALALKNLGKEGKEILNSIPEEKKEAHQVCSYVLRLPTSSLGKEIMKWFDANYFRKVESEPADSQ